MSSRLCQYGRAPYAWEVESDSEHDGPDGGDVYACMSAEDAAAELVQLLAFLKHSGKLPAIYASQIARFASRAGAVDATTLAQMLAKAAIAAGSTDDITVVCIPMEDL